MLNSGFLSLSTCLDCLGTGHSRSWWDPHLIKVTFRADFGSLKKSLAEVSIALAQAFKRWSFADWYRDAQRHEFDRELEAQLFYGRD